MNLLPQIFRRAALVALWLGGATAAHAKLTFEATTVKLPAQWSDTKLTAVFKFKNDGAEKVSITEMETNCGCTAPALAKKDYAPGETGELRVDYTLGGQTGFQRKSITLKTDQKDQPLILLALETTIPAALELQPQLIYWRTGDTPTPKKITITLAPGVPVEKLTATLAAGNFKTDLKEIKLGQVYELTITPAATDKITRVEIPLTLQLKDGQKITRTAYAMVR